MNREIKFRAWDTIDKRMRYEKDVDGIKEWPSLLAVGFHGLPICIDKDSVKEHEIIGWNRDHNLTLMQYTGLKDKNGTEIYEGDIVTMPIGNDPTFMKAEIVYSFDGFKFKWINERVRNIRGKQIEPIFHNIKFFEVISNIFENSDLLSESK